MKQEQPKTYTVTVTIEVSCQFSVEASSIKEAKALANELAGSSVEITFDGECQNPDVDYRSIEDDAVEE